MQLFFLSELRLILLFRFIQRAHISLCNQQLLSFLLDFPVLGIDCFLSGKEFCIFRRQFLYLRDLPDTQFVKSLLRRFMESDLFTVSFEELSAVSGLPVGFIGAAGFGVVDDMLFQRGDLGQALLGCLNRRKQFIPLCGFLGSQRLQLVQAVDAVIPPTVICTVQKDSGLNAAIWASRITTMASVGVMTRPTASVCPYRHEKSRVAFIPTIQSARSRQRAASYKASYAVPGFSFSKPSRMAASSSRHLAKRSSWLR